MKFRACYIEEVEIDEKNGWISLIDSKHNKFFISMKNCLAVSQFKTWFNGVFKPGITQYLTVFQYRTGTDPEESGQCFNLIVNFLKYRANVAESESKSESKSETKTETEIETAK